MAKKKSIFQSKIAWAALMVAVLSALQGIGWSEFVDEKTSAFITSAIGLAIIVFRKYFTTAQIGSNKPILPKK